MSLNEKHPQIPHKPVVDFNAAIIFNPMMMVGSVFGVIINTILPGVIVLIILAGSLFVATLVGFKEAFKLYNKENEAMKILAKGMGQVLLAPKTQDDKKQIEAPGQEMTEVSNLAAQYNDEEIKKRDEMIERISQSESSVFPWDKMVLVIGGFLVTVLTPFILGGKGMPSIFGVELCTGPYIIWTAVYVVVVIVFWWKAVKIVRDDQEMKEKVPGGWPMKEAVTWENKIIFNLSAYMFGVGVFSAIVGVGGGIYIVPTLLAMGYIPAVVSATSLFLVFWAKFASTILFLFAGDLLLGLTLYLGILSVIGSYISITVLKSQIKKLGRQSIISFCFAGFVMLSCCLSIYKALELWITGGSTAWIFNDYCTPGLL